MIRQPPHRRHRGTAIVEMALILPVFLLLILGLMDASRLFMVASELTVASREGCRIAATNGKTSTDVANYLNTALTNNGIKPSDTTITLSPTSIETTTLGTPITLTLSIPFNKVSYLGTPFLFASSTISISASMSSERP